MNYLDLFHGIGGFALGAFNAGLRFDTHYCSDIEPYCQKLYAQRFPDSIQLGDITKIDTSFKPFDRKNQLKGLGNAIVPQIAELIFRQIKGML